jgi:hypothetical protein
LSGTLHYRVRFRDPFDTTDVLVVSTVPTDDNPFIVEPPEGDGTKIDPLTGVVEVGEYVVRIADEVGTITLPTLLFDEQWLYETQAARNLVWAKTTSLAAAYGGGDNGGYDGLDMHMGITYGGGIGGGGGYGKHTRTVTGLTPGASYTLVCDSMTLSRELGGLDDCGISINGGEGWNVYDQGLLEGPLVIPFIADGAGEVEITLGHFDLEYGMTGIVITVGRLRIFGPGEELETRVVTGWLGDDDGQWQVLGCKAFVDESTNVGADWTTVQGAFVTHVELAGGIEYAVTLGESDRRERMAQVFTKEEGSFEATRLIGAPPGFGPLPDAPYDSWVFTVEDTGDTSGNLPSDAVVLEFVRGYMYEKTAGAEGMVLMEGEISNETRTLVNTIAPEYAVTEGGITVLEGLTARVYANASGQPGDLIGEFGVYGLVSSGPNSAYQTIGHGDDLIMQDRLIALKWGPGDLGVMTLPAQGTVYHVIVTPDTVSESNPLHFTGHLVDFVTELFRLRQIDYDQASADAVKAALGQMRAYYRFTEAEPLMDAVEKYAFGPGGFAVRPTPEGEWEFILTRHLPSTLPTETLTEAKVHDPDTVIFALDIQSIVNRVVWKQLHWTVWKESMNTEPPPDGIIGRELVTPVEPALSLIADLGTREIVYDLPGEIIIKSGSSPKVSAGAWFVAMGTDILRRWGRGCPEASVRALRGQSAADIGDFILLDLGHLPTAETGRLPSAQRIQESGSTRIVQVIHRTRTPAGFDHTVLDVGPGDDATELVPEFTLALTSDDPRHTAEATLTNHLDLAGFLVRMEMGTGATEPDGGVTVEVFTPDDLPHRTFPEEACSEVWVRMRAEPELGGVAGPWSDWQSITLECIPAVTDLSADAGGNCTEEAITWTVGDADLPVRVRWKLTAATDYTHVIILPAGSDQYVIGGLVPGSAYTVEVAHLDLSPFSGAGTVATDTWTACGDVPVLNPPIDPLGFTNGAGTYGLEVTGTEFPSNTVFEEAIETAVASGVYGSYAVVASPATTAGRIHFESFRANDGLTVSLRAKHTRSGWTDSAYTTPQIVDPWGDPDPVPPGGGVGLESAVDTVPIWSSTYNAQREFTDYEGDDTLVLKYSLDDGATWAAVGATDTPALPLDTAGDIYTGWAAAVAACTGDPMFSAFHADDVEVDAAWRFRRPIEGATSVRLQSRVSRAGGTGIAPRIKDFIVQFWAQATAIEGPDGDDPVPPPIEFDDTDLLVHYKSYAGVTVDGSDIVTALVDQSAPEINPDEYGGTPVLVDDVVNGHPVIRFSGLDYFKYTSGPFNSSTAAHLFCLLKMTNANPPNELYSGLMHFSPQGRGAEYPYSGNTATARFDWFSFSFRNVTLDHNVTALHVLELISATNYFAVKVNGVLKYETTSHTFSVISNPHIGCGGLLYGQGGYWDLVEWMHFGTRQDDGNDAAVRTYLYDVGGIAP